MPVTSQRRARESGHFTYDWHEAETYYRMMGMNDEADAVARAIAAAGGDS